LGAARVGRFWWLAVLPVVGSGCGEMLGPERFETTRVTGVVREGQEPVRGGWIEFVPVDGTVGNMRSAPIRPDGTFSADRVAVGPNRVGLVGVPTRAPGLRTMFDTLGTEIQRVIPPGPSTSVTIDVLTEAALRSRRLSQAVSGHN
jgi:hypothetical protein